MGKEKRLFKSQERKSRAEVGEFLHQIAEKLVSGQVVLRREDEELALDIPANLVLEVQVESEQKKGKRVQHSLEIEIKWTDGDDKGGQLELG